METIPIADKDHFDKPEQNTDKQLKMAILLFEHIEGQIRAADNKAWLIVVANGVLVNLFTKKDGINIQNLNEIAIFLVFSFVPILVSIFFALKVVSPVLTKPLNQNLFFFENIINLKEITFVDQFQGQQSVEILSALLSEVHVKAKIASLKFLKLRRSFIFFFIAIVIWIIVQAYQFYCGLQ